MTGDIFWLRWARPDGAYAPHSGTPTVADCEADGWTVAGKDPRYPSLLMRRDEVGEP